jgi:hypothetical protein
MKIKALKFYNDSEVGFVKKDQEIDVSEKHAKMLIENGYGVVVENKPKDKDKNKEEK